MGLHVCSGMWWTSIGTCKISSKDEMISCQIIKWCRWGRRSCRVCRTKSSSAKRMRVRGLKNMDNLGPSSKTHTQKMKDHGNKIQAESWVEAELDLEFRGLQAWDERRVHPNQMDVAWTRLSCTVSSRPEQRWPDNSWHLSRMSSEIRVECRISQRQSIQSRACPKKKAEDEGRDETEQEQRKSACRAHGPAVP